MPQVFVSHQDPGDLDKFEETKVDDFSVFINKDLKLDNEVRVKFPQYASDLAEKEFEVVGATPPTD